MIPREGKGRLNRRTGVSWEGEGEIFQQGPNFHPVKGEKIM